MKEMKPGDHEGMNGGAMSVRGAVFDRNGVQVSEVLVDDRVCECCPTAAAVTSGGPIVAFRNRTSDEIRDIYVSRFVSGKWTEPVAVHKDNWRIAACPVNGPALSANGRDVAIAWFTAVGNEGHVYTAFSSDAGQTFGPPVRIDDVGAVGRVDVELLADGSAAVTWIEFADQRSEFRIRRVERPVPDRRLSRFQESRLDDRVAIRDWPDEGTNCYLRGSNPVRSLEFEQSWRSSRPQPRATSVTTGRPV